MGGTSGARGGFADRSEVDNSLCMYGGALRTHGRRGVGKGAGRYGGGARWVRRIVYCVLRMTQCMPESGRGE